MMLTWKKRLEYLADTDFDTDTDSNTESNTDSDTDVNTAKRILERLGIQTSNRFSKFDRS